MFSIAESPPLGQFLCSQTARVYGFRTRELTRRRLNTALLQQAFEADLNVESLMRAGAMLYDSAYALGSMFQSFLKDQPDILENLRDSLAGYQADGKDASDELIFRFQQWLDEQDIEIDDGQRTILMQIAEAFADFAVDAEESASLALV